MTPNTTASLRLAAIALLGVALAGGACGLWWRVRFPVGRVWRDCAATLRRRRGAGR